VPSLAPVHSTNAMTREDIAPTGGLCFERSNVNIASTHNPHELIERLMQRQPSTSLQQHHESALPTPVDLLDGVLSLHEKLEEAARMEEKGASSGRPEPVLVPAEPLPRAREKAALLREWFSPASSCSQPSERGDAGRGTESDSESERSSDHDSLPTGLSVDAPPLAYTLVPEGFAIYVDTPLRKRLAATDDEEDEESSDEEYEEDSDDDEGAEPRRRVLGVLDVNIEYH